MNTNQSILKVGGIEAIVLYKPVKNLHLNVLPPVGKVRVTAPQNMKDDAIYAFLASRISWIERQQAKFKSQERQTRREYMTGENYYLWGKRYRLEVIYKDIPPSVSLKGKKKIILSVRPRSSREKREQVMRDWYRKELRSIARGLIDRWQKKIGVKVNDWRIRRMKTRWGSCNQKAGRIWLNLELAKKPEHCLTYIIVHELIHILEKKHNDRFKALMDKFLPQWRQYKDELNNTVLSYEEWKY